jgi:hypothetical protein
MKKQPGLTLYVFNGVEHEWEFISSLATASQKKDAIRASNDIADTYLFSNPQSTCIFVSPIHFNSSFISYAESLLHSQYTVIVPSGTSHLVCKNLIEDQKGMNRILEIAKLHRNTLILKSYASSQSIHTLARELRAKGVRVLLPETTKLEKLHTVSYFGSKSGFRTSFSRYMPEGYICNSPAEALKKAMVLYERGSGVVIKTDRGCSGEGVHIFRKKEPFLHVEKKLAAIFDSQPYWKQYPIIVECYVPPAMEDCPFPSIEGYIDSKGKLSLPYYCNMIVTPQGEFYGVEIHKNVVSGTTLTEMIRISKKIGNTYAKAGYRGRFDIDFLHDGTRLFANESNMRTNGGTDTYLAVRALVGTRFFTERYVLSNFIDFPPKRRGYTFHTVSAMLAPYLYNVKTKTGVIISSDLAFRLHGLSIIIIARSAGDAQTMQQKIILTIQKNKE